MEKLKIIARYECDFPTKFGLPRQSGLNRELTGRIVFERAFRNPDAVRGLNEFSHIWLIWGFQVPEKEGWSATVRPPRLGGNERVGVFASRSPFRPNPLGLTVARLEGVDLTENGPVISVSGADMMDQTPIYDIKPYIPYADSRPDAVGSFAQKWKNYALKVIFPDELLALIPEDRQNALRAALEGDPRPAYQHDPKRLYGFAYAGFDVRFSVDGDTLTVREIVKMREKPFTRSPEGV